MCSSDLCNTIICVICLPRGIRVSASLSGLLLPLFCPFSPSVDPNRGNASLGHCRRSRAARGRSRRGRPRRELARLPARRVRSQEARAAEGPPVGHLILAGQIRQAPRSNSASPRRKSRRPAPATASDPGQPPSCSRRSFSLPRLSSHGWDK